MVKPTFAAPYHHGNLREALVEAGVNALSGQVSAEDVSLRELARHVGVSANAAYRHFANKGELLQAVAAAGFRDLLERSVAVQSACATPQDRLRAAGLNYVRYAREHPALFGLMFGRKPAQPLSNELQDAAARAFEDVLSASAAAAGIAPDDSSALIGALKSWTIVHGLAHLALDGHLDSCTDDVDGLIEQLLDQFAAS